jgi:CRISPR/Cas system-associated exonuclease Cas4 (RecB family)
MAERKLSFKKRKKDNEWIDWLYQEIEAAYLDEVGQPKITKKETFSPSSIGYGHGRCPRYWYMAFDGKHMFTSKTDARGMSIMMNGTKTHDRIQGVMIKRGIMLEAESEIKIADPPIRGYIDGKIKLPSGETVPVIEIKSTNANGWEFRRVAGKPTAQHRLQILIYLKATGSTKGVFLYENKDTQEILLIPVDLTEENNQIIEDVFSWLREVRKAWEDQILPMRPARAKNAVICKTCPLYDPCWNELGDGEVKIKAMEVIPV